MESGYHWLVTVGLVASSIIATTANSFLLVVFCRKRSLRSVPNRFVINLLITNLLSSILLIPFLLADQEIYPHSFDLTSSLQNNETIQEVIIEEEIISDKVHSHQPTEEDESIKIVETTKEVLETVLISNSTDIDSSKLLCYFAQSSTSFVCTASIFSILLIGINQYFGVIHSLRYHFYINKCRSTIFIVSSWFVALLFAVLNSLTYSDNSNSLWNFCQRSSHSNINNTLRIFNTVYAVLYFVVVILAPFVAICVIYVCIYTAAHKNSERMRKSRSANSNLDYMQVSIGKRSQNNLTVFSAETKTTIPKVHSAPNFSHLVKTSSFNIQPPSLEINLGETTEDADDQINQSHRKVNVTRTLSERTTNKFINTIKHKISNASVFRYREETRAAKISILVIFTVLVCYIPYGVTLVLNSEYVNIRTNQIFHYLSLILLTISNIISPFLFGYRNKRVKREIAKIFGINSSNANISHLYVPERQKRASVLVRNRSFEDIHDQKIMNEPFLPNSCVIPEVIVTCKTENERKSILKRVCNTSNWSNYKKCNFITVPDSCISGEARGSFSSASTQISSEE